MALRPSNFNEAGCFQRYRHYAAEEYPARNNGLRPALGPRRSTDNGRRAAGNPGTRTRTLLILCHTVITTQRSAPLLCRISIRRG